MYDFEFGGGDAQFRGEIAIMFSLCDNSPSLLSAHDRDAVFVEHDVLLDTTGVDSMRALNTNYYQRNINQTHVALVGVLIANMSCKLSRGR